MTNCTPAFRKLATTVWLAAAAVSLFAAQNQVRAQSGIEVVFQVAHQVTLHEPVVLRYTILNGLYQPALTDLGTDGVGALQFVAVGPDGKRQQSYDIRREGLHSIGRLTIPRHGSYTQAVVLNQWMDFSEQGSYAISVDFRGRVRVGILEALSDAPIVQYDGVPDNPIKVEVLTRDERRLRELCEGLAARAEVKERDSDEAIQELRYVRDPIAIPYLERVLLKHALTTYDLVTYPAALGEIGGPQAKAALERLAANSTPWIAFSAKQALGKMR